MKTFISIAAASAFMISSFSVFAAPVNISGDYSRTTITGLDDEKYYTVTADTSCSSQSADAFIRAGGNSTVIPNGEHTVYIRGVAPENGSVTIEAAAGPGETVTIDNIEVNEGEEYTFYQGGDITEANYIASLGGKYFAPDSDKADDPVKILAQNGVNMARIRLSNSPGKGRGDGTYYLPEGFQDKEDCLDLAKRAKDNGMSIEFTFNLSDYWSNAERQIVPSDWVEEIKLKTGYDIKSADFLRNMTEDQRNEITNMLTELTRSYITEIMTSLKEQNTVPEFVSIGNEVNGGLLFPFAPSFDMQMNPDNFTAVWGDDQSEDDIPMPAKTEALAQIMNAGYDAVKAISPETQVVLHLANGAKLSSYTWALDIYENAGVKYDILGASYYPAWSDNTVEGCVEFCNTIYEQYKKPILIMETGFNWNNTRKDGYPGQLIDIDAYKDKYPPTPAGQQGFLSDLYNGLKSVNGGACIGAIYWDPLMIHVEDPATPDASLSGWAYRESDDKPDGNVVENTTLFDFDGKALPALNTTSGGAKISVADGKTIDDGVSISDKINISAQSGTATAKLDAAAAISCDESTSVILYTVGYDENGTLSSVTKTDIPSGGTVITDTPERSKLFIKTNDDLIYAGL